MNSLKKLPLLIETPESWAHEALSDIMSLLSDHAYLERKAASNALEMLNRWPEPKRPKKWAERCQKLLKMKRLIYTWF